MADDEKPSEKSTKGNFITKKLGPLPLWAWAAIAAGSLGALYILHRGGSGTTAAGSMAGQPGSAGVTSGDPLTLSQLSQELATLNHTLAGQLPSAAAAQAFQGVIRTPGGAGSQWAGFDSSHNGVPVWSDTSQGSLLSYVPWNATVTILDVVQGKASPNDPGGPSTWYKVNWGGIIGWVNADNFGSFLGSWMGSSPANGPTGGPPIFATPLSNLSVGAHNPSGLFAPSPTAGTSGNGSHIASAAAPKIPILGGHG
jgi:hypothetical protein